MCTAHTVCSTLHGIMAHISSVTPIPRNSPAPDHYWLLSLPFSVNLDSFPQCDGCHIMFLFMSLLLFLSDTIAFSQVDLFQQVLTKTTLGYRFHRGHFCVTMPSFYHLQYSFDKHITWGFLQLMALGAKPCLGCKFSGCHCH